jgi:Lon protease-like protein
MSAASFLPETIPVFPLAGALLLPRGRLPLRIFEPRYMQMTDDALRSNRVIGMVQPMVPDEKNPRLYEVGCLGRLASWSETGDSRYAIALTGVCRFRIRSELSTARLYRMVNVDYSAFLKDMEAGELEGTVDRERLAAGLRQFFRRNEMENLWPTIEELPDDLLVNALSMICPFPPAEKQALLEAADVTERAQLLMALVEMNAADPQGPEGTLQ